MWCTVLKKKYSFIEYGHLYLKHCYQVFKDVAGKARDLCWQVGETQRYWTRHLISWSRTVDKIGIVWVAGDFSDGGRVPNHLRTWQEQAEHVTRNNFGVLAKVCARFCWRLWPWAHKIDGAAYQSGDVSGWKVVGLGHHVPIHPCLLGTH